MQRLRPGGRPGAVRKHDLAGMNGVTADRHADHPVAIRQKPVDVGALSQDRPQVDGGPGERLREAQRQELVIVRVVQRRSDGRVQGRLEIEDRRAIEPGDCHPVVDLPGTVRPQPGLLAFLQGHVEQWGGSIADVHAGTIQ